LVLWPQPQANCMFGKPAIIETLPVQVVDGFCFILMQKTYKYFAKLQLNTFVNSG
jgi:hypothetical protein